MCRAATFENISDNLNIACIFMLAENIENPVKTYETVPDELPALV
jgi:hypothetical protein